MTKKVHDFIRGEYKRSLYHMYHFPDMLDSQFAYLSGILAALNFIGEMTWDDVNYWSQRIMQDKRMVERTGRSPFVAEDMQQRSHS